MTTYDFLLYGANGYTGRLIAERASFYGLVPLLAGRNGAALAALAEATGFDHRVVELSDTIGLDAAVQQCRMVVHAAGPFRYTMESMILSCLRMKKHYIDINGDISCFEQIKKHDSAAQEREIMLLPGAGFDVVPTDSMALLIKKALPDADRLRIAFASLGSTLSHGTAMTMSGKLGEGGMVRKNGVIIRRPLGEHGMQIDFGTEKHFVMSIPWGDVSTAWHTTGIPDIETFTAVSPSIYRAMKFQWLFNWLLRSEVVRKLIRKKINKNPSGPDAVTRSKARSLVWVEAGNSRGETASVTMSGPEVYDMTAHAALLIAQRIISGSFQPGYQTPAGCYGTELVKKIPGVEVREVRRSKP
jgi:short subunit dehydrogenase-like uncharacterized protein